MIWANDSSATPPLTLCKIMQDMDKKMHIMGFVGTSISKYKAYDGSVAEHAQAVGKAAKSNDIRGTELMFRTL